MFGVFKAPPYCFLKWLHIPNNAEGSSLSPILANTCYFLSLREQPYTQVLSLWLWVALVRCLVMSKDFQEPVEHLYVRLAFQIELVLKYRSQSLSLCSFLLFLFGGHACDAHRLFLAVHTGLSPGGAGRLVWNAGG